MLIASAEFPTIQERKKRDFRGIFIGNSSGGLDSMVHCTVEGGNYRFLTIIDMVEA